MADARAIDDKPGGTRDAVASLPRHPTSRKTRPTVGLVAIFTVLFIALWVDEHHASAYAAGGSAQVAPATVRSNQSSTRAWYPKGPVDEAMFQQLRKPWLSPGDRARFLARGELRVGSAEFGAVLEAARAEEREVRAGLRPPLRRSVLCGEVVCAPLFARAE